MNNKAADYRALKKIWYKKLKDEGFNEIEDTSTKGEKYEPLKRWSSSMFKHRKERDGVFNSSFDDYINRFKAIETYYIMAEHFYTNHKFNNDLEKFIWGEHQRGISMRNISKLLKARKTPKAVTQVKEIIHKLRAIMYKEGNQNE